MKVIKLKREGDKDMYAARIEELGLTAYGRTVREAMEGVQRLLGTFILQYGERMQLEDVVKRLRIYEEQP